MSTKQHVVLTLVLPAAGLGGIHLLQYHQKSLQLSTCNEPPPGLLGGWRLNKLEGTKRCRSPACWSWSRSAAGRDSVGRSCSSAKTAREREMASEETKSAVLGAGRGSRHTVRAGDVCLWRTR